jgi:hypothetical protein
MRIARAVTAMFDRGARELIVPHDSEAVFCCRVPADVAFVVRDSLFARSEDVARL